MSIAICPSEGVEREQPERALWLSKIEHMLCDLSMGASRHAGNFKRGRSYIKKDYQPGYTRIHEMRNAYHWFTFGADYEGTCSAAGVDPDELFLVAKQYVRAVEAFFGRKYEDLLVPPPRKEPTKADRDKRRKRRDRWVVKKLKLRLIEKFRAKRGK